MGLVLVLVSRHLQKAVVGNGGQWGESGEMGGNGGKWGEMGGNGGKQGFIRRSLSEIV